MICWKSIKRNCIDILDNSNGIFQGKCSFDECGRDVLKYYENDLRGTKGKNFYQKDRFNRIIGSYENGIFDIPPKNSNNLTLTIDLDIQEYGEKLMKNKWGGIVAIEPKTGEVLALVSAPSYNPNLLIGRERSKNYSKLSLDTISKPLFDRGLQAQYAPGSPFKTINALVALQEGTINDKTIFQCNEGHYYAKGMHMECFCQKGSKNNLLKAIYKSCNTFFANTYRSIIDKDGNCASVTTSNGEGSGYVIPETGIMLNNMLGEEDLNPNGFHNWESRRRLPTMMSPTIITKNNSPIMVLGSGGSNRIRSAIVQVLINYLYNCKSLKESIESFRVHLEGDNLYYEDGAEIKFNEIDLKLNLKPFNNKSLFFGGVNAVTTSEAYSDARRGGAYEVF